MKLETINSILSNAKNMRDIFNIFTEMGCEIECDCFESDEVHYFSNVGKDDTVYFTYNFEVGTCYITTNSDDGELVLRFGIVQRYICN